MLEGLLESMLTRTIGQYIEELDRERLSVSLSKGDVRIENLKLKKNLFEQLKLPFQLVFSQVDCVRLTIPWSRLISTPCELKIDGIKVVVSLKGRTEWATDHASVFNDARLKEAMLDSILTRLFANIKLSMDHSAQEQSGVMQNIMTRCLDNLQVFVTNLHFRLESDNSDFCAQKFSLGATLESLKLQTTDKHWSPMFIDRTTTEGREMPLNKLLEIVNFGLYHKPNEDVFVGAMRSEHTRNQVLTEMQKGSKIHQYCSDYLLEPIQLQTKLVIQPKSFKTEISLEIKKLAIAMHKSQLRNLAKLAKRFNEYQGLIASQQLKHRNLYAEHLERHFTDAGEVKSKFQALLRQHRDHWTGKGTAQARVDPDSDYDIILLGCSIEQLQEWALPVIESVAADEVEREKLQKTQKSYTGSLMYWLGYAAKTEENGNSDRKSQVDLEQLAATLRQADTSDESLSESEEEEFFDVCETKVPLTEPLAPSQPSKQKRNTTKHQDQLPTHSANFVLNHFCLTLDTSASQAIEIYSTGFTILGSKYDDNSEACPNIIEIRAQCQDFGIEAIDLVKAKSSSVVQRIASVEESKEMATTTTEAMSEVKITKSNQLYNPLSAQATSPRVSMQPLRKKQTQSQPDVDFTIVATLLPLKIIYRQEVITSMSEFFQVGEIDEDLKLKAGQKLKELQERTIDRAEKFVESKKKNIVRLDVKSPVLELPFSNSQLNRRMNSSQELWQIKLGDFSLTNESAPETNCYETFCLKLSDGRFTYLDCLKSHALVEQFTLYLDIGVKKTQGDSELPNLQIRGEIREIELNFTPYLYCNFVNISSLFTGSHSSQKTLMKLQEKGDLMQGDVQIKGATFKMNYDYTGVLCDRHIYFFRRNKFDEEPVDELCVSQCSVEQTGQLLRIQNQDLVERQIVFATVDEATRWSQTIEQAASEVKARVLRTKPLNRKEDYKNQLKSTFEIRIHEIGVKLFADRHELKPELAEDDPYDAGIFSIVGESKSKFRMHLGIQGLVIKQKSFLQESNMKIQLENYSLKELGLKPSDRFEHLLKSENGLQVKVETIQRTSPRYDDQDMAVHTKIGKIFVRWKPKTIAKFLRFVRYFKDKQTTYEKTLKNLKFLHQNFTKLQAENSAQLQRDSPTDVIDCETNKNTSLFLDISIQEFEVNCLHPHNDSYPLCSFVFSKMRATNMTKFDHDEVAVSMGSMEVLDHTNYPRTLDPKRQYTKKDALVSQKILYEKKNQQGGNMLEVKIVMFHSPLSRTCSLARKPEFQGFDKHVACKIKSMHLVFLMEQIFRLQDYFFYQFIGAASDSDPYKLIHKKATEHFEAWKQTQNLVRHASTYQENVDSLQQYQLCTGLDISVEHPMITLQDRPYLDMGKVRVDFGNIHIHNSLSQVKGRWRQAPDRLVTVTTMLIKCNGLAMNFLKNSGRQLDSFVILPDTNFSLQLEQLTPSKKLQNGYLSRGVNFEDLDISQHIRVNFTRLGLHFTKEACTFLQRCNDLNLCYTDSQAQEFQLAIWDDPDTQKYLKYGQEIKERYTGNHNVFRTQIKVAIPSFSVSLRDENTALIAELVFWNFKTQISEYLDGHRIINLDAQSLQILRDDSDFPQTKNQGLKALVMGHENAQSYLVTDLDYYLFNVDRIINKVQQRAGSKPAKVRSILQQKYFEVSVEMFASGEKAIRCQMSSHKLVMRTKILLQIQDFFMQSFPKYDTSSEDKPVNYTGDVNSAKKQEINFEMKDTTICFENQENSHQMLVWRTSLFLNRTRFTINEVKLNLLDRIHQSQNASSQLLGGESFEYDYTDKIGLMIISLTNFTPYLCLAEEMDGRPWHQVQKRELMSPFNLHYNLQSILELRQRTSQKNELNSLVFKLYSKSDISIDWTLIKVTFKDLVNIQKIMEHNQKMIADFEEQKLQPSSSSDESHTVLRRARTQQVSQFKLPQMNQDDSLSQISEEESEDSLFDLPRLRQPSSLLHNLRETVLRQLSPIKEQSQQESALYVMKKQQQGSIQPSSSSLVLNRIREDYSEEISDELGCSLEEINQVPDTQHIRQSAFAADQTFPDDRLVVIPRHQMENLNDKELLKVIYQESDSDKVQVVSFGFKFLIINDSKGNFLPVLGFQLSEFMYQYNIENRQTRIGKTEISSSIDYYNALAGNWEPAIERFDLGLQIQTFPDGRREFAVQFDKEININVSESLLDTISDTLRSFNKSSSESNGELFKMQTSYKFKQGYQGTLFYTFDEKEEQRRSDHDIIVTPYAICNMTEGDISIEREIAVTQKPKRSQEPPAFKMRESTLLSKLIQQSSFVRNTSSSVVERPQFETVLVVKSGQQSDLKVDYEKQVKKQISQFTQSSDQSSEIVNVSFDRANKLPIEGLNLNKLCEPQWHQFQSDKHREPIVYEVSFKELKRVLTVRTLYVLQNSTSQSYSIKIANKFDKSVSKVIRLDAGQMIPLPESYNQSILQIKLDSDPQSDWSSEWYVYAIKHIIKPQHAGFILHGSTFTFFRKQQAKNLGYFNINLMPPLILKNCLPCDLHAQFVDSNKHLCKLQLEKEETKNIFQFDLRNDIKLQLSIPGFSSATLTLSVDGSAKDATKTVTLYDLDGCQLTLSCSLASENAGFCLKFYLTNCIVNEAEQNLTFFYSQPSRGIENVDQKVTVPMAYDFENQGDTQKYKLHMLSQSSQVWAKIDGGSEVSDPINTFTPEVCEKFSLVRKNRLYEYGYKTQVQLANPNESIYTKVTTISPLYNIVNYTKATVLFAQTSAKQSYPFIIKPQQIIPFHWHDKDQDKMVAVRVMPDNDYGKYNWSSGIRLDQVGSLVVYNRLFQTDESEDSFVLSPSGSVQSDSSILRVTKQASAKRSQLSERLSLAKKRFLRISRKHTKHQYFVIIEEEDTDLPSMKVENECRSISIKIQQAGNQLSHEVDQLDPNCSQGFAWTDNYGQKLIKAEFFTTIDQQRLCPIVCGQKQDFLLVSLDELNKEPKQITFALEDLNKQTHEKIVYQVTTNGYTKILKFEQRSLQAASYLKKQHQDSIKILCHVSVPQINISLIGSRKELLTMYFKVMQAKFEITDTMISLDYSMGCIQFDNQSERDPIYPVMLSVKKEFTRDSDGVPRPNNQDYFQLSLKVRRDVENVICFELVEFLVQHVELRLELSHLMDIAGFFGKAGRAFSSRVVTQDIIFKNTRVELQEEESSGVDYLENIRASTVQRLSVIKDIKKSEFNKRASPQQRQSQAQTEYESHKVSRVYIREYIGSPLKVTVSLIKQGVLHDDNGSLLKTISSLGLSISTFEGAPITLNSLRIANIFGDSEEVIDQMKAYYISCLKQNALRFLGASSLIGNPIKFIDTLGTGFQEFYYEPYTGYMTGGIASGGLGLAVGATKLVTNTLSAGLGSISKMSASLSSGILTLTGDESYISRRNMGMVRQKPKGVLVGLGQGLNSALSSGWSGLQGVVAQPSEGYRAGGVSGVVKGVLQGTVGLIIKPTSGVLDLVVKTSEGIENQTKTSIEQQQAERIRKPRAFYGSDHIFKSYDVFHADILFATPTLRYQSPDLSLPYTHVDVSIFQDAWTLGENEHTGYIHVFLLFYSQTVQIKKYQTSQCLKAEQLKDSRLQRQGNSLAQIVSVQKISELKDLQLHDTTLYLDFEDGREILEVRDNKTAKSIHCKIQQLQLEHRQAERLKRIKYQFQKIQSSMYSANSVGRPK